MDLLHDLTLGDVVREHGRSRPLQTALVCGGYRGTYPELDARTDRLANALLAAGLGDGDTVLWLGQNCHRLIETLVACAKAGGVLVPANWRQSADELVTVMDDVAPAFVIWQAAEIGATVREARDPLGRCGPLAPPRRRGRHGRRGGLRGISLRGRPGDPGRPVDPAAPVIALFTAAFGGRPNGALLSHDAVLPRR